MEITRRYTVNFTFVKGLSHQTSVSKSFKLDLFFKFKNSNTDSVLIIWK